MWVLLLLIVSNVWFATGSDIVAKQMLLTDEEQREPQSYVFLNLCPFLNLFPPLDPALSADCLMGSCTVRRLLGGCGAPRIRVREGAAGGGSVWEQAASFLPKTSIHDWTAKSTQEQRHVLEHLNFAVDMSRHMSEFETRGRGCLNNTRTTSPTETFFLPRMCGTVATTQAEPLRPPKEPKIFFPNRANSI